MHSASIDSRTPVETLRDLFERVFPRRDPHALLAYWAEDIVVHFPDGIYRGRDQVRDYFAALFRAVPDFEIEAKSLIGEGHTVFVRWRARGTLSGAPWLGIGPTGTRIEIEGIDCFTLKNGLIVENFVVFDQMHFARQIGLLPTQGSRAEQLLLAAFNARTSLRKRLSRPRGD